MNPKNLTIGTQLKAGLAAMLLFVLAIGLVSYLQTNKINRQTELMYERPLVIRNAIGEIKADAFLIHWALEIAFNKDTFEEMLPLLQTISTAEDRMIHNIELLRESYLADNEAVEQLHDITTHCKENRDHVIDLMRSGNFDMAYQINIHTGTVIDTDHFNEILREIQIISDMASEKADALLAGSKSLNTRLSVQLTIIIAGLLFITFLIFYALLNSIRSPLLELTEVTERFDSGDMNARSPVKSKNELGRLAGAFNNMADNIQLNNKLADMSAKLAKKMLSEDDARKFFHNTLSLLMEQTGSQMAAAYLLTDDKNRFEHYVSIGLDDEARKAFSATGLEGEMGAAVAAKNIQHLKNIPGTTRFVFNTTTGTFIPREIITMPILSGEAPVAVLTLASVYQYSTISISLINEIHDIYSARILGILAYRNMKKLSHRLEVQNRKLEVQQKELASQTTELTAQNRELEVQKTQLNEANRLKTSFLSNMSHELRTPLNSVIALSGVLNRRLAKQIPAEEHSYLEVIERNGKHLLSLINDILDISRIESGKEEIELSDIDLCDAINEVIQMMQPQADEKRLQFQKAAGDCKTRIKTDAIKVRHILQNLVGNAVKFTEKGSVSIAVEKTNNKVKVIVADTGIGISEEHKPHIFDEFRQADSGISRRYGGSGLGLSIAKKYANLLGGTISVKSTAGKGSTFILTLPIIFSKQNIIAEKESPSRDHFNRVHQPSAPLYDNGQKTVMIVEDSEPAIIQMQDILEESGYKVVAARGGNEALSLFEQLIPDAIILDLMMPKTDGFEVLEKIRSSDLTAHIPVLILTAKHLTKNDLKFLKRNNIHELIQKGDVKRNELLASVKNMIKAEQPESKERMPDDTPQPGKNPTF